MPIFAQTLWLITIMIRGIFLSLCALTILGCSKERKYSGAYFCEVDYYSYDLYQVYSDTIYQDYLEANREKKSLIVLNRTIPGDSLIEGEWYYHSGYPSIFKIKVVEDSMYVSTWSGGQGGGSSHFYSCKQE